ncbi:alpha/beta hydrolase [uncultured Thiodictyon sp.]|uniref:alpha/beta fold hydrolase n=1 Tax=uncultured Thiodictyon sp. TaxID=1846217 RepID=UPI0025D1C8AF|nr:alpha/beta hydrolase [uncultured Thiodictyon sp.]
MNRPRLPSNLLLRLLLSAGALLLPVAVGAEPGQWAKVNGHRMYYLRAGSGSPVLLLHGGGDSGEHAFANQIGALIDAGHEVIAPDQVGQGRTPGVPGPLSYGAMMQDTAALLRRLRIDSVDLVGFSDGGILGLMLAIRYPELVNRLVVSGVNISPAGLPQDHLEALQAESDAAAEAPEETGAKLRELWLHAPTEQDLSPALLATIRQPVLLMAGDHDLIRLDHTIDVYRALPNAQLFVVPDTGHGTFDSRPNLVNPVLLGFLARA